jgi:V8-like Glu-specific endopeptidase
MSVIDEYPLPWQDPRIQQLHASLAASSYKERDIEAIVSLAGVPPENVSFDGAARHMWFSAMNEAAGRRLLPSLIGQAVARYPQLEARVAELLAAKPVLSAPLPPGDPLVLSPGDVRWRNFSADNSERRIVESENTMLDVVFLRRGLDSARAVCRLTAVFGGRILYGTGFRVGSRTLLTNHHVLHDWTRDNALPSSVQADFGYELDAGGKLSVAAPVGCDVTTIRGEREHDFAVIQAGAELPADVTVLPLDVAAGIQVGDRVYIVQHPSGLPKKIALAHNLVRSVTPDVVQYWTDTEAGSSGSPVFDDRWRVVALHHQWVDAPQGDGLAYRNQGRAISKVIARMTALGIDWEQ